VEGLKQANRGDDSGEMKRVGSRRISDSLKNKNVGLYASKYSAHRR